MAFEWDEENEAGSSGSNFRKHRVRMPEAIPAFNDPYALSVADEESDPNEQRLVTIGLGEMGRILVVVYTYRGQNIRIIGATRRTARARRIRGTTMKDRYDFSKGNRGVVLAPQSEPEDKLRITISLDQDVLDRFFQMAEQSGGSVTYQMLINSALRQYLDGQAPKFDEDTLRRIIREELRVNAA